MKIVGEIRRKYISGCFDIWRSGNGVVNLGNLKGANFANDRRVKYVRQITWLNHVQYM